MTPAASPPVLDSHVNLASERTVPRSFIEDQADNVAHRMSALGQQVAPGRIRERLLSLYQDHHADRLVAELDAAGIGQAVLVAPDYSHVAPCALDRAEIAALHDEVRRRHPGRFRVFWGVDPRSGDAGVELFERCVTEYGFDGLKVYPLNGYSPSDPGLYPYYELCRQWGLPVLTHTGPAWQALEFAYGRPLLVDRAARDFPEVDFVLGHGGVRSVDEAVDLCVHRPNLHLDIAGFQSVNSPEGWQAHLNTLFRRGVNHKILFGSDWSAYRAATTLPGVVRHFTGDGPVFAGVKPSQQRLIMGGNLLRLLSRKNVTTTSVEGD